MRRRAFRQGKEEEAVIFGAINGEGGKRREGEEGGSRNREKRSSYLRVKEDGGDVEEREGTNVCGCREREGKEEGDALIGGN